MTHPKIALVGVPAEIVPIMDSGYHVSANIPGLTDRIRRLVIETAAKRGVQVQDLGEASAGDTRKVPFAVDRVGGIPEYYEGWLPPTRLRTLEQSRKRILKSARDEYDLLVAVGPSHLGAIVLYEKLDVVARLDYHADFTGRDDVFINYATYMDWVRRKLKKVDVINFFVREKEEGIVFGRESSNGDVPAGTNHFDIDVDCFDPRFQMQRVYEHNRGGSGVTPEQVLSMIRQARPRKLGIWEYRQSHDPQQNGIEFIVDAIEAAAGKSQLLNHAGNVPYLRPGIGLKV